MDHYAVMGNPVAHSKSPRIHALFAKQTKQQLNYQAILVKKDDFNNAVADFLQHGGMGLNITVPLKEAAWALATTRSQRAERAGAVNTLVLNQHGRHFGDNTDGTPAAGQTEGTPTGCESAELHTIQTVAGTVDAVVRSPHSSARAL